MTARIAGLSERELQFLRLMCAGRQNKQIAADMRLSKRTVETHRSHLMHKSGCLTSAQLGVWAVREGFIEAAT